MLGAAVTALPHSNHCDFQCRHAYSNTHSLCRLPFGLHPVCLHPLFVSLCHKHRNLTYLHAPSLLRCLSVLLYLWYLQAILRFISNRRSFVVLFLPNTFVFPPFFPPLSIPSFFPGCLLSCLFVLFSTNPSLIVPHRHPAGCFTVWIHPLLYVGSLVHCIRFMSHIGNGSQEAPVTLRQQRLAVFEEMSVRDKEIRLI